MKKRTAYIVLASLLCGAMVLPHVRFARGWNKIAPANRSINGPSSATLIPATQQQGVRGKSSLEQQVAALESINDPELRQAAIDHLAQSVAGNDLRSVLESSMEVPGEAAAGFRSALLRRWDQADPQAVKEWCVGLAAGSSRSVAFKEVALLEANRDLKAAAAWAMDLPPGPGAQSAKTSVAYEAARTDPVQALGLASTLPATPERDDLLVHVASQWATVNFTNAAAWALSVSDTNLRERVVGAVAVGAAKQDPAASALLAALALPAGTEQNRAVLSIVQRWVAQSPEQTADWVSRFPATPVREAAVTQLLSAWVSKDAGKAQQWLEQLPEGELRDTSLTAYAYAIARASMMPPQPASGDAPLNN